MRLLISNDDGIDAPGIAALADAASAFGDVWVVAPDRERSAHGHAFTMHEPLRAHPRGPQRFAVSGTPADAVYLGIHKLLPEPPALVLAGINDGSNLGNDVFYSGTVAAAMEGALLGLPAIAISLHKRAGDKVRHWETAQDVARRVIANVLAEGLPRRTLLNVNVPNVPLSRLAGLKTCVLGERRYHPLVLERLDPRGRTYYWIGGDHDTFVEVAESDGLAIDADWATVTPIVPDVTHHDALPQVRRWTDA